MTWRKRKSRLSELLHADGDENAEGAALDRLLHGQSVIGKTSKTIEVDALRFTNKDLSVAGTLEYGQFGVIDVVTCKLDGRVYIRKSIQKDFAIRTRDQCSPEFERDILLRARKYESFWVPHLLCAFHTPSHLNLMMDYAEGGSLWDVIESSPHDGKLIEDDIRWWAPQAAMAISWCHEQGFAHRDIKPQNFVLKSTAHLLLIDFGSAAPLLPPKSDGSRMILRKYCQVPCGTCDYLSPEILETHEQALVAMEMDDEESLLAQNRSDGNSEGYGRETDWWSYGVMLYEMAYGVTPFFAKDIRQTYMKITNHRSSLRFDKPASVSSRLRDLLQRLMTDAEERLGRRDSTDVMQHPFFRDVDWDDLHNLPAPDSLHLPQFEYTAPIPTNNCDAQEDQDDTHSQGFAFSQFFESSKGSEFSPSSNTRATPPRFGQTKSRDSTIASFIGFSWGPPLDAFDKSQPVAHEGPSAAPVQVEFATPRPANRALPVHATPRNFTPKFPPAMLTPRQPSYAFATPTRPYGALQQNSAPRSGTAPRASRRAVSDREAMEQILGCVQMSARKRVLDSGRKASRISVPSTVFESRSRSGGASSSKKELRSGSAKRAVPPAGLKTTGLEPSDDETDTDGPVSPSPSPRPGSTAFRRTQTPSTSSIYGARRAPVSRRTMAPEVVASGGALTDDALDDLERRHGRLVRDIMDMQARLERLSAGLR